MHHRSIQAYVIGFICCCLLIAPHAQAQGTSLEERKAKQKVKQKQLAYQAKLKALSAYILAKLQNQKIAMLDLRSERDTQESIKAAQTVNSSIYEYLLSKGIGVYRYEKKEKLSIEYKKGKLPKVMITRPILQKLVKDQVGFVLEMRLSVLGSRHLLTIGIIDVQKANYLLRGSRTSFTTTGIDLKTLVQVDALPTLNRAVLEFAIASIGNQVARGECWDLPATILKQHGGKVAGYNFGTEIKWPDALPGDVITFGDSGATGGHVVVLSRHDLDMSKAAILHQNVGGRRFVMYGRLSNVVKSKTGQAMKVYRPQSKK